MFNRRNIFELASAAAASAVVGETAEAKSGLLPVDISRAAKSAS
jgi:hypothetical protein